MHVPATHMFPVGYLLHANEPNEERNLQRRASAVDVDRPLSDRLRSPYLVPALAAGRYRFSTTGYGGDADLYVRVGQAPTLSTYTCKSDGPTAVEKCEITLTATSNVYVHVKNASNASGSYTLEGVALP